jgi:hypothetical protein
MKLTELSQTNKSNLGTFYPRIIREFEENDEPMIYGEKS